MTKQKEHEKKILTMQRDLVNEIMNYAIIHGSASVAWNVNIKFMTEPQ